MHAPMSNNASHDEINSWVSFSFLYGHWVLLSSLWAAGALLWITYDTEKVIQPSTWTSCMKGFQGLNLGSSYKANVSTLLLPKLTATKFLIHKYCQTFFRDLTCSSWPLFLTGLRPPRKSADSECMWQLTANIFWFHSEANNWQMVVLPQLQQKH